MQKLIIATRKSKLAIIQSEMIKSALMSSDSCEVDLLPLSTTGDKDKNRSLLEIGGKGLFTKEIEEAVIAREAQIAMHSLKDMPVNMPDDLMLAGVLPRESANDVLISHNPIESLDDLAQGSEIGTSSPRRAAQLLTLRPDLKIKPFRGNVPTRLQKIENGEIAATILAAAGLKRLNITPKNFIQLKSIPAIGQGLIAIQCRKDDKDTINRIQKINHSSSWHQAIAERSLLQAIEGDCQTPLAGHASINGEELTITAQILRANGDTNYIESKSGHINDAENIGKECGEALLPKAEKLWQR